MNAQSFLEELEKSLCKNDIVSVRKIFSNNMHMLKQKNHPECSYEKCRLLTAHDCNVFVKEVMQLVNNFPKFLSNGGNIDLRKYFFRAIFAGNSTMIEIYLMIGNELKSTPKTLQIKIDNEFKGDNILLNFFRQVRPYDHDVVHIAKILLNSGIFGVNDRIGEVSALHYLMHKNNIPLLSFFLEKRADVNSKADGEDEETPLFYAVFKNNVAIVDLMISYGANVNYRGAESGYAPIFSACYDNNFEIINSLTRAGADLTIVFKKWTPFSYLVPEKDNYNECVTVMIKELSKRTFKSIPVAESDIKLIRSQPSDNKLFESCLNELKQMETIEFYPPYNFICIIDLTLSTRKLANFSKNQDLVLKFQENLNRFFYYKRDLQLIWNKAIHKRDEIINVERKLYSTFKDFFPDIIIRKICKNLNSKDLSVV